MVMLPHHRVWLYANWISLSLTHRNVGNALTDLETMIGSVRKNFGEEEQAMLDRKVPVAEHAREHYEFVERFFGFRDMLHTGRDSVECAAAFRALCEDLRQHIGTRDIPLSEELSD